MADQQPPGPAPQTPPASDALPPTEAQDAAPTAPADTSSPVVEPAAATEACSADQTEIDELLKQASFEAPGAVAGIPSGADAAAFDLPSFQRVIQDAQVSSIDLLRDVELNVKIELGRSRMLVEDVLKLGEGSVVELDKLAGDPVDVFVNDRLVARGEVLVLNDNFCVRVNEIVAAIKEESP